VKVRRGMAQAIETREYSRARTGRTVRALHTRSGLPERPARTVFPERVCDGFAQFSRTEQAAG